MASPNALEFARPPARMPTVKDHRLKNLLGKLVEFYGKSPEKPMRLDVIRQSYSAQRQQFDVGSAAIPPVSAAQEWINHVSTQQAPLYSVTSLESVL
jgi:hypothetical protein